MTKSVTSPRYQSDPLRSLLWIAMSRPELLQKGDWEVGLMSATRRAWCTQWNPAPCPKMAPEVRVQFTIVYGKKSQEIFIVQPLMLCGLQTDRVACHLRRTWLAVVFGRAPSDVKFRRRC